LTVGDAWRAGHAVKIECLHCHHIATVAPHRLVRIKLAVVDHRLNEPVGGFYCRTCRLSVVAFITAAPGYA
jgi:ribosomal protein S27E